VYFTDENSLALGKLLRQAGRHALYPGHEDLPEVPRGALDLEWMPVVGRRGLIVLTRDRRIRTRPIELDAYREAGIRSVWIGAKRDLTTTSSSCSSATSNACSARRPSVGLVRGRSR
jgi:hypothetical protein